MPPRPRPRPHAVLASSSPVAAGSQASTSAVRKSAREEEEEEDDLFIRSKGRSLKEVHKRVAQATAIAQTSSSPTGSDDEDGDGHDDDEETPKQELAKNRRRNVYNTGKVKALPKWAKRGAIENLLGDSDSELENNDPSKRTPSRKRHGGGSGAGTPSGRHDKRARTRSRSRSLTPPPDLTQAERIVAHNAIQQALNSDPGNFIPRSLVIELEDEGDEIDGEATLDPALQHIAQAVRDRALKQKADNGFDSIQHSHQDVSHHHSSGGSVMVTIRVKWIPHPEDEVMHGRPKQSWVFKVKRHDSLKELFLQTSDKAHVLAEDLVLMRGEKQVFTSVSPEGLGFWDQGELEACDRITFDALRLRHFRSPTPAQQYADDPELGRGVSAPPSEASLEHPDDTDKFKLLLRAPGTKEITLSVRSTTTCGKIVRAFLAVVAKQEGKAHTSPRKAVHVRLCIDGEKQHPDTPISDCDLEDGDMVEVVGM